VLISLLSFVTACVFIFSNGFHHWETCDAFKVTVEIPINMHNSEQHAHTTERVLQELKNTPSVRSVKPVDPEKLRTMLKAWTGDSVSSVDLSLPALLDVEFHKTANIDLDAIKARLRAIAPDVGVENHSAWSHKLVVFGQSLRIVTLVIGSFILFCTAVIVVFVTKSALQAYYSTLDVLRLLGAKDSYIARIFQNQILKSSFFGGICGTCLSVPIVYAFMMVLKYLGLEGITWNTMMWHVLLLVSCVPLVVAFLGILVSRVTVLVHLRVMDNRVMDKSTRA
jgi:cell division transport system permease protein